jgi:CRP-like cAMP-binding protein
VRIPGEVEALAVAAYARGSYFGELGFLLNKPRNATVQAMTVGRMFG